MDRDGKVGHWQDLVGLWAVVLGTDDLSPRMGTVNTVWGEGDHETEFQVTGGNGMPLSLIRAGRVLLFATEAEARCELKIHEQAYLEIQRAKGRAELAARDERLKAVKTRLGV